MGKGSRRKSRVNKVVDGLNNGICAQVPSIFESTTVDLSIVLGS